MFGQNCKHKLLKDSHMNLDKFVHDIYVTYDYLITYTLNVFRPLIMQN
jgi:hypothetical protein